MDSFEEKLRRKYEAVKSGVAESLWAEEPISFSEFAHSPEHMFFPKLSDRQQSAMLSFLGDDPKSLFTSRRYKVGAWSWGKGSGKDSLAALGMCFQVYVLLCLKDPQSYLFGAKVEGEPIDLLNVAPSAELASQVFFEKLRQRVLHWKWLRKRYRVRLSGRDLDPKERVAPHDVVTVHPRDILFPHNIRCFSRHGNIELTEGFNVLWGLLDEAGAIKNPDRTFDVLESSAKSRFPNAYRLMVLGYPRKEADFTLRMVARSIKDPSIYASVGSTWEILPSWKFCGKTFEFRGMKIPIEFKEAFDRQPERSLLMYACIPQKTSGASFYKVPEKVAAAVNKNRQSIAEYEPIRVAAPTGHQRVGKQLVKFNISRQPDSIKYYAKLDCGLKKDSAVLCVGHMEGATAVIDLILEWEPNYSLGHPVDFENVTNTIVDLKQRLVNIVSGTADQWNSAQMLQALQNVGIQAEQIRGGKAPMETAREAFYAGRVSMLDHPKALAQLLALIDYGNHVDVDPDNEELAGHDDVAVCLSGLIHDMLGYKKGQETQVEGTLVQGNEGDGAFAGFGSSLGLHGGIGGY